MPMGPITVDFTEFVGLRVNEHVVHTWDVEVALDPGASIPEDLAAVVVENLGLIAQYTGKYEGDPATVPRTPRDLTRLTPFGSTTAPSRSLPVHPSTPTTT